MRCTNMNLLRAFAIFLMKNPGGLRSPQCLRFLAQNAVQNSLTLCLQPVRGMILRLPRIATMIPVNSQLFWDMNTPHQAMRLKIYTGTSSLRGILRRTCHFQDWTPGTLKSCGAGWMSNASPDTSRWRCPTIQMVPMAGCLV